MAGREGAKSVSPSLAEYKDLLRQTLASVGKSVDTFSCSLSPSESRGRLMVRGTPLRRLGVQIPVWTDSIWNIWLIRGGASDGNQVK